jgi:hypothetical protein
MTVVFTGKGNVSQGAQEIFDLLPVKRVRPWQTLFRWNFFSSCSAVED